MTTDLRALAIALAVLVSAPAAVQAQNPAAEQAAKDQKVDHARERCTLNHGVDCDSPRGQEEWLLQDRNREDAVRDGSRYPVPAQPTQGGSSTIQPVPAATQPGTGVMSRP